MSQHGPGQSLATKRYQDALRRTGMTGKTFRDLGPYPPTGLIASSFYATTIEGQIQRAINESVALQPTLGFYQAVFIPLTMLGFNPALITMNPNVSLVIEGQGMASVFDIRAFGGKGDGVTDNAPALAAAIAAVPAQGGTIYFPAGVYIFNSSNTINARTDIAFIGAGRNATRLQMGVNGVNLLNFTGVCSRIIIRDLWLGATQAFATGTALSVVGTSGTHSDSFYIDNVTVQNAPQPWVMQYLDNSNHRNIRIIETISGAITAGVVMNLNSCVTHTFDSVVMFSTLGAGALGTGEGIRVDYDCDSIDFVNCQVLDSTTYNWRFCQTAGSTGPRLCRLTNCYSESSGSGGYLIQACRDLRLSSCEAAVNGGHGYLVSGGDSITITNSLSLQNQQHGIDVTGGTGVLIHGNTCSNNGQQTDNTYDGIHIEVNVVGCRVSDNRSGDFIFTLTNKQRYGLVIEGGTSDYITVSGNDLRGNKTAPFNTFSTGTNNTLDGVFGYNVKTFGALGDGATDDSAAIQNAVTAAALTNGRTLFPPTTSSYKIASTVVLPALAFLEGLGPSSDAPGPELLFTNTTGVTGFSFTGGSEAAACSITLKNLQLFGPGSANNCIGLRLRNFDGLLIDNCDFNHWTYGVWTDWGQMVAIRGTRFILNTRGIVLGGNVTQTATPVPGAGIRGGTFAPNFMDDVKIDKCSFSQNQVDVEHKGSQYSLGGFQLSNSKFFESTGSPVTGKTDFVHISGLKNALIERNSFECPQARSCVNIQNTGLDSDTNGPSFGIEVIRNSILNTNASASCIGINVGRGQAFIEGNTFETEPTTAIPILLADSTSRSTVGINHYLSFQTNSQPLEGFVNPIHITGNPVGGHILALVPAIFNVKAYGAKGDNSTNDTTAIQNAIDAQHAAGAGKVILPAGNYVVTTLTYYSGTWIEGEGFVGPLNAPGVMLIQSSGSGVILSPHSTAAVTTAFTLRGFGMSAFGNASNTGVLDITNCTDYVIEDVLVNGYATFGVRIVGGNNLGDSGFGHFVRVIVNGGQSNAYAWLISSSTNDQPDGCTFTDCRTSVGANGHYIHYANTGSKTGPGSHSWKGCTFEAARTTAANILYDATGSGIVEFTGCRFENTSTGGISVTLNGFGIQPAAIFTSCDFAPGSGGLTWTDNGPNLSPRINVSIGSTNQLLTQFTMGVQNRVVTTAAIATQPLDCNNGNTFEYTIGTNIAVVIQLPTHTPVTSITQDLTVTFFNNSGGALTTAPTFATGAGGFLTSAAVVNPGNGTGVTYTFRWSPNAVGGARFREVSRTVAF